MLANEHRAIAGGCQSSGVGTSDDSRFGDPDHTIGNLPRHTHRSLTVNLKRTQVTLVHPDQTWVNTQGPAQFCLVVHLNEGRQTKFNSEGVKGREFVIAQRRNDQ